jgi:hypothetical protein
VKFNLNHKMYDSSQFYLKWKVPCFTLITRTIEIVKPERSNKFSLSSFFLFFSSLLFSSLLLRLLLLLFFFIFIFIIIFFYFYFYFYFFLSLNSQKSMPSKFEILNNRIRVKFVKKKKIGIKTSFLNCL